MPIMDELNEQDIMLGDVYVLNYYGIKVFFQVCQTDYDRVCLYELKTKVFEVDGEKKVMVKGEGEAERKSTLVIPLERNTYTKSDYWVGYTSLPGWSEQFLKIDVTMTTPIYMEAVRRGVDCPVFGTCYAKYIPDWYNRYWDYYEHTEEVNDINEKGYEC